MKFAEVATSFFRMPPLRGREELAFLPAALEIVETPVPPTKSRLPDPATTWVAPEVVTAVALLPPLMVLLVPVSTTDRGPDPPMTTLPEPPENTALDPAPP